MEMKFDCLRYQCRKLWWAGFAARMGEKRSVCVGFLWGNLKTPHRRWEYDIKMDLRMGRYGLD